MTAQDRAWSMTEAQLQESIRKMCKSLHIEAQHIRDPIGSWLPGWPDLALFGRSILFAELKRQSESPTPEQRRVGWIIQQAGGRWTWWRPSDLLDGTIAKELTAIMPLEITVFSADSIERFMV